jgi:hypothetical protein
MKTSEPEQELNFVQSAAHKCFPNPRETRIRIGETCGEERSFLCSPPSCFSLGRY